jgi:hypothetical protein
MNMFKQEWKGSPRPDGTRKYDPDAFPGLRCAPSGAIFVPSLREEVQELVD